MKRRLFLRYNFKHEQFLYLEHKILIEYLTKLLPLFRPKDIKK